MLCVAAVILPDSWRATFHIEKHSNNYIISSAVNYKLSPTAPLERARRTTDTTGGAALLLTMAAGSMKQYRNRNRVKEVLDML